MLVIMAGLPGTGKSTLVREVLHSEPGICFSKDTVRLALFPPSEVDYTTAQDDVCMEAIFLAAGYVLRKDPSRLVFLDGRPFARRSERERVLTWAAGVPVSSLLIECVCADDIVRERLKRGGPEHPAGNRDFALYLSLKTAWEPILETHFVIDTSRPLQDCTDAVLRALHASS